MAYGKAATMVIRYNLVPAKLEAVMNDDELTCILVLGENSVNNNNVKWSERSSHIDYPTHPPIRRMLNVNSQKFLSSSRKTHK